MQHHLDDTAAGVRASVRASDHDRDTAAERLGDALSDGALDAPEYHARLGRALAAATRGELDRLTADLPPSPTARRRAEAALRTAEADADKRAWKNEWAQWAGGAVVMTAIWAVTSLHAGKVTSYWPAVPIGIWAAVLVSYAIWPSRDD